MKCLGAAGLAWLVVLLGCLSGRAAFAQDNPGTGTLLVEVPEDAKVEINGYLTHKVGARREFSPPGLQPGFDYQFVIRAWVIRDGRTREDVKTVRLQAGQTVPVAFDLPAAPVVKPGAKPKNPRLRQSPRRKSPSGDRRPHRSPKTPRRDRRPRSRPPDRSPRGLRPRRRRSRCRPWVLRRRSGRHPRVHKFAVRDAVGKR